MISSIFWVACAIISQGACGQCLNLKTREENIEKLQRKRKQKEKKNPTAFHTIPLFFHFFVIFRNLKRTFRHLEYVVRVFNKITVH